MSTLSISLSEPVHKFVEKQVASGFYRTVSDYVQTLIQEDQERKRQTHNQSKISLIELLDEWDIEDATDDPQELARREQEWETLKQNLNANRCATGERLLFPCEN